MQSRGEKTHSTPDHFIEQTCTKAAGEQARAYQQLFTGCAARPLDTSEVIMLSGFLPLLAMSLAQLHKDIQRDYTLAFSQHLSEHHGRGCEPLFAQRTLEYLAAFHRDITGGNAAALPALLGAALEHIFGSSDDTLAACRTSLLQTLIPRLRADVEHYGTLSFASA
jgi:hypothetical protein